MGRTGRVAGAAVPAIAFAGVAVSVIATAEGRSEPAFQIWAALVLVMAPVNLAVFVSGFKASNALQIITSGRRWAFAALTVAGILVTILVFGLLVAGSGVNRGFVLVAAALVATVPTAVAFADLAVITRRPSAGSVVAQIEQIGLLQRIARRLLVGAGSLVALTTVSLGAAVILANQRAAHGDLAGGPYTPQVVLVFGGVGSALLASAYLPGAFGIRARATDVAAALFPLPDENLDGPALLAVLRDRAQLLHLLSVDRTVWSDLQSGSVILAPLLAAAATTFISPQ